MSSLTPEAYAVIEGRPSDPLCKVQGLPDENPGCSQWRCSGWRRAASLRWDNRSGSTQGTC